MVPFARRVRTIRMCSLDARGLGPIQATLFESASYTTAALLDELLSILGSLLLLPQHDNQGTTSKPL